LVGITGAALLDSIMTEKYVALFQNIEVWSDYKRTCLPALTPYLTANGALPAYQDKIPGRFYYGATSATRIRTFRRRARSCRITGSATGTIRPLVRRSDVSSGPD